MALLGAGKNPNHIVVRLRKYAGTLAIVTFLSLAIHSGISHSETASTIKIIVPYGPGGGADTVARLFAAPVSEISGKSFVVVNRPGAAGMVATEVVSRAAPDGNTLLLYAPDMLINQQIHNVQYDAIKSFEPICLLVTSPGILAVNSGSPFHTLADFIEGARAKPGSITVGGAGALSPKQIGLQMLSRAANVELTYIPFDSAPPAIAELLGSRITAVYVEYAGLAAHLKDGTLRALATTSKERIAQMPDLPTVAESGYKDYEVKLWWGLVAPAGTPTAAIGEYATWFTAASQVIKEKLDAVGFSHGTQCGASFGTLLQSQFDNYGRVVREMNLTKD